MNSANDSYVLILYYSRNSGVARLAQQVARGVEGAGNGLQARLRTVPPISANHEATAAPVPDSGAPYATLEDLANCAGLALGSPTRFGNMAAPLKYFLDQSSDLWMSGGLIGRPAGVFTASATHHGGQESTLLSMMIPLLHHGMVLTGVPYSEPAITSTTTGGTPYGASHVSGSESHGRELSDDESAVAKALGRRLAILARQLQRI